MNTSLLILIWVGIVAIIALVIVIIRTMLRLQAVLKEVEQTVDNVNSAVSIVEKVVETGAKGILTAMSAADIVKAGLNKWMGDTKDQPSDDRSSSVQ